MDGYRWRLLLIFLCLTVHCVPTQAQSSSINTLSHIGPYKSLKCKRITIDIPDVDVWYARLAKRPVFSSDATKYAADIDADITPGSGEYIAVKSLAGDPDIILNPRPDNDYTKGTVKLSGVVNGRPNLQYIHPCDWSPDSSKLLIAGRSGEEGFSASIWAIDLKAMKGSPVSRELRDEKADSASFSPDGRLVAYVVTPEKHDKRVGGGLLDAWSDQILIANVDGTNTKRLARGSDAAWSPDSKRLLIVSADHLVLADTAGKHRNLTFPVLKGVGIGSIGWLDDSHFVVTVIERTEGYRRFHSVWILDSRGQRLQVIESANLDHVWPQTKTLILVEEHLDRKGDLWLVKY